jgi:hypothetical protein
VKSAYAADSGGSRQVIQVAVRLLLQHFELVGRIAGGVALDAGSGLVIRPTVKLLPVLIDQFEVEISSGRQSLGVGGGDFAPTQLGL